LHVYRNGISASLEADRFTLFGHRYEAGLSTSESWASLSLNDSGNKEQQKAFDEKWKASNLLEQNWRQRGIQMSVSKSANELSIAEAENRGEASLSMDHGEPSLELNGSGHSSATLGNIRLENTRTGSTENTGPASLVLFGKDGHVTWRAP
jgi:hypothetical protein